MNELFFVYGTLKRGYGNNRLLATSEFLGKAQTVKHYKLFQGYDDRYSIPMARPISSGLPIAGEVYSITDERVFKQLDWLEGEGRLYFRNKRDVYLLTDPKKLFQAWVYEIPNIETPYLAPVNRELGAFEWGLAA